MTLEPVLVKPNDFELISRAQQGDTAAFEMLVQRHDQRVLTIAASYTGDPDETKDVYQEVFLRVYRALPDFQFKSEFSTWLYRIVTNVCLTYQMRAHRHPTSSLDAVVDVDRVPVTPLFHSAPPSPELQAQNSELSQKIKDAVETLSPQQKIVFTLKHFQGYKLREIASMMNCGEGTVKKYLFTATEKMRKRLKKVL